MSRRKPLPPSSNQGARRAFGPAPRTSYAKGRGLNPKQPTGHSTQLGPAGIPRGEYGTYDKSTAVVPDNVVNLAVIHQTTSVPAVTIARDVVVDLVGIEKRPTIPPVTIIQAGQTIDLAVIHQTQTVPPVSIFQTATLDQDVFLETIHQVQTVPPITVEFENVVDLAVITQTTSVPAVEVDVIGIGQVSLTPADFLTVRNTMLDWEVEPGSGLTLRMMFRAQYAELVGLTQGEPNTAGMFGYLAAGAEAGGTLRVQGQQDGRGKRLRIVKRGD